METNKLSEIICFSVPKTMDRTEDTSRYWQIVCPTTASAL